jgi:hypothetical protein
VGMAWVNGQRATAGHPRWHARLSARGRTPGRARTVFRRTVRSWSASSPARQRGAVSGGRGRGGSGRTCLARTRAGGLRGRFGRGRRIQSGVYVDRPGRVG